MFQIVSSTIKPFALVISDNTADGDDTDALRMGTDTLDCATTMAQLHLLQEEGAITAIHTPQRHQQRLTA